MSYRINVLDYFEELVSSGFDGIAVVEGEKSISFRSLYDQAKVLALSLQNRCNQKTNQIIAVYTHKSIETVISDLAILMSGNYFLNLDVKNPEARIKGIVEHCKVNLIISRSNLKNDFFDEQSIFCPFDEISIFSNKLVDHKGVFLNYKKLVDTDPLCVINTSGSTGIPKAVLLSHRGIIDFIEAVKKENLISGAETIGSLSPSFFDIYLFELCMLLVWGSKLVIIPESMAVFPIKMLELMKKESVSFIFWVPTVMVNIANNDLLSAVTLTDLKKVWFAGEVFPSKKFKYWAEKLPCTEFVNMYGPIEIHVDCLFYKVEKGLTYDKPLPIGKPFFNTSILLLDDENQVVKDGEEGELCIRGSSVALGYYNDPEKTAKAFVQNPINTFYPETIYKTGDLVKKGKDGNYLFLGRKDTLIKRMGYRIELAEIEHIVVNKISNIKNCCVIYKSDSKDLVLFYESEVLLPPASIKKDLMKYLPRYMLPTIFNHLDKMPKNPNGKIDRRMLKESIENATK